MSNVPADLKYTEHDEWIRVEADGTLTIGITDYAQDALGDIVFLDLPEAGRSVNKDEAIAVVESVKAASTSTHRLPARSLPATKMRSARPNPSTATRTPRGSSRSSRPTPMT